MRVLIVSEKWGAEAGIGSLRPMKIAKYLIKNGHQVSVICNKSLNDSNKMDADLEVLRTNILYNEFAIFGYSGIFKVEEVIRLRLIKTKHQKERNLSKTINSSNPIIEKHPSSFNIFAKKILYNIYYNIYNLFKESNSANSAYKIYNHNIINADVIFSSYGPLRVTLLAKRIIAKYPKIIWISDFRDPIPWAWDPYIVKLYKRKLQVFLCNKADVVTTVSNTWKEALEHDNIKNVHTLYSGFDIDDYNFSSEISSSKCLTFTYTGCLYPNISDIRPLIDSIYELINKKMLNPDNIIIKYAGVHEKEFDNQVSKLKNHVSIINYGLVSREKALKIQRESDVLIHASWNKKNNTGMMTGKIYEYMLAQKTVVSIITGDEPYSELGKVIRESNMGFAYEQASEQNLASLEKYIMNLYNEKIANGTILYKGIGNYLSRFNYNNIVVELTNLINTVSK